MLILEYISTHVPPSGALRECLPGSPRVLSRSKRPSADIIFNMLEIERGMHTYIQNTGIHVIGISTYMMIKLSRVRIPLVPHEKHFASVVSQR